MSEGHDPDQATGTVSHYYGRAHDTIYREP